MGHDSERQGGLLDWLGGAVQPHGGVPVYIQLGDALRRAMERGQLRPGDTLPTVRALAAHLRLAPNTVSKTYAALQRDGLTENRAGAGTTVTAAAWAGRLNEREALHDLRERLTQLLAAGITPAELRAALDEVLGQAGVTDRE